MHMFLYVILLSNAITKQILQIECDKTYTFPRASLNAMGDLGLLGLIIPKEFGGMGESHTCAAMVVETLARYGCPASAMIYSNARVPLVLGSVSVRGIRWTDYKCDIRLADCFLDCCYYADVKPITAYYIFFSFFLL